MDFLLDVRSDESKTAHVRFGLALARRFKAHLTGLQVIAIDASLLALPDALLVLDDEESLARGRKSWWHNECHAQGVDGSWEVRRGVHRRVLTRRASFADLLIGRLQQKGSGIPVGTGMLARVLMSRAAPMILIPDGSAPSQMDRLLLTWNGSAVSARAIRAALPFIARASDVIVLAGERDARDRQQDGDALLKSWLERNAVRHEWIEMTDEKSPAISISAFADTHGSEGIVLGAWGHSRLQELALGGTTRHLLAHSKYPLFLSA
jgi:nucleotide-binding universal stress UspA family protein